MKKENLKVMAGVMVMVFGLSLAGCGNATNSNSDTQRGTTVTQETVATVTVQPTTAEVTTMQTTEPTTQDVGVVPPNYKRRSKEKVLAFSKDTDFEGFKWSDTIGFNDDINTVLEFVNNNAAIEIPAGTKVNLNSLEGYSTLSDELRSTLELSISGTCGDTQNMINKKGNLTFALVLTEINGKCNIQMFVK